MATNPLAAYASDIRSQHGEDGVIEYIFSVIGVKNKWCLELGALNGTHHSNSWNLIANKGWSGLLIEADITYYRKLEVLYKENPKVKTVNAFVSFEGEQSLNELCKSAGVPANFDLLVLDIDGADYHLWDSLTDFAPRVVCIEFNETIPNNVAFVQPKDMSVNQGSSLNALNALGERKGYRFMGTVGCNAFFVVAEAFGKFGITDSSLDALNPDTSFQTQLYQLYDGTLVLEGYRELRWHKVPIDQEKLQVLSKRKRKYPAHIDPGAGTRRFKDWARQTPLYSLYRALKKLRV